MMLQRSLALLVALCLFSTTIFAEDATKDAKKESTASNAKSEQPTDSKQEEEAKSEKPVPPAPPKKDAKNDAEKKDEASAAKGEKADTDLATDVDSLRLLVKVLRAELDAVKASRAEEQKALKKAKKEIDGRFAQMDALKDDVKKLNETLAEVAKSATTSQAKLDSVIADSANFLAALDEITEKDGDKRLPKVLGNLRMNKDFRNKVLEALDVQAEVVLHNNEHKPTSMWVNGTLHRLQPGKNAIRVAYGPVTLLRYTTRTPRVFTNWKSHDDGFVMEFDVGARKEPKKPAEKKVEAKESEEK